MMMVLTVLGLLAAMAWGATAADTGRYLQAYVCSIIVGIAGLVIMIGFSGTAGLLIGGVFLLWPAYGIWRTANKRYQDEQTRQEARLSNIERLFRKYPQKNCEII